MKPTSGSVHSLPSAGFGSCAVPPGPNITLLPHPPAPVPQDISWVDPTKPFDNFTQQQQQHFVRYHHQEQCPHYNNRWSSQQAICVKQNFLLVTEPSVNGISKISCDCLLTMNQRYQWGKYWVLNMLQRDLGSNCSFHCSNNIDS